MGKIYNKGVSEVIATIKAISNENKELQNKIEIDQLVANHRLPTLIKKEQNP